MSGPSATCQVKDGAGAYVSTDGGVDVTPGNTVTVKLVDAAGADVWQLTCVGCDEIHTASTVTSGITVNLLSKTATFTAPAAGSAYLLQSYAKDNGSGTSDTKTFKVCTRTAINNLRVGATNEQLENDSEHGSLGLLNQTVRQLDTIVLSNVGYTLDAGSAALVAGDWVCLVNGSTNHLLITKAVSSALTLAGVGLGIVTSSHAPGDTGIQVGIGGTAPNSITGLGNSTDSAAHDVYIDATARSQYLYHRDGGEPLGGRATANGRLTIAPVSANATAPFHTYNPKAAPYNCPWDGIHDDLPGLLLLDAAIAALPTGSTARVDFPPGLGYLSGDFNPSRPWQLEGRGGGVDSFNGSGLKVAPGKNLGLLLSTVHPTGGSFNRGSVKNIDIVTASLRPASGGFSAALGAMTATRPLSGNWIEKGTCVVSAVANTTCYFEVTSAGGTATSNADPAGFATAGLAQIGTTIADTNTTPNITWTVRAFIKDRVAGHTHTSVGERCAIPGDMRHYFELETVGTTRAAVNISNCATSAGIIKVTTSTAHNCLTGDIVLIAGVTGTTEANGTWRIDKVDATNYTLRNSAFVNAYVSGGTSTPTPACDDGVTPHVTFIDAAYGDTVIDGTCVWRVKSHVGLLVAVDAEIDHCAIFGCTNFGIHLQSDWATAAGGGNFSKITNNLIYSTGGGIYLKGGNAQGITTSENKCINTGWGGTIANAFLKAGGIGLLDLSEGGNYHATNYMQDGLGFGHFLNPLGALGVSSSSNNENNYPSVVGPNFIWNGASASGVSGTIEKLASYSPVQSSANQQGVKIGMVNIPSACRNHGFIDDTAASGDQLTLSVMPQDGISFFGEQQTGAHAEASGVRSVMSDFLAGVGVVRGWHAKILGTFDRFKFMLGLPGDNAILPQAGGAAAITSLDAPPWVMAYRLIIGPWFAAANLGAIGFAASSPAASGDTKYWYQGSLVFNTAVAIGSPIGFMPTAAGSPGTWVAGPLLPDSTQIKTLAMADTNQTLASPDYYKSTIQTTGALTAARTLTLPTALNGDTSRTIDNQCTGAFAVKISPATGDLSTNGVANGKAARIYCDGTNWRRVTPDATP